MRRLLAWCMWHVFRVDLDEHVTWGLRQSVAQASLFGRDDH